MNQLPSEVLIPIFKQLYSNDMVKVMRVCRNWLQIIEQNKSLWRSLVLPERVAGWQPSILELFDRKSQSSLREINMGLNPEMTGWTAFPGCVKRSQKTLRILVLTNVDNSCFDFKNAGKWPRQFPCLMECRINQTSKKQPVRLVQTGTGQSSSILWIPLPLWLMIPTLSFLGNLSTLKMTGAFNSSDWRMILEPPSQTLKHVGFVLAAIEDRVMDVPLITFPQLQVVELQSFGQKFPSWMKIPNSATAIVDAGLIDSLPSVSTIWTWVDSLWRSTIASLADRCPTLATLRLDRGNYRVGPEFHQDLLIMLAKRREKGNQRFKVDGIEMIPLQTIIIYYELFDPEFISQLRSLVGEVVDAATIPDFVEVEI